MGLPETPRKRETRPGRALLLGAAVLIVVVLASLVAVLRPDGHQKHVTAYFDRATGIYRGSEVRILGVEVGRVTKITPRGAMVEVAMAYDAKRKIPSNAQAVIIVPSLVADRYVQFTPVYRGGEVLRDGATLPLSSTVVPVELDDANAAINELTRALGPQGANAQGSLSRLLKTSAQTLNGQGENLRTTLQDISEVSRVLAGNRGDMAATVRNLAKITQAMAASDAQIRSFSASLATVSGQLNAERTELRAALKSLSLALRQVAAFVKHNKAEVAANVRGLAQITGVLVKQRAALRQFLDQAPVTAANALLVYDAQSGTLHSRMNLQQTQNIAMWLCSLAYSLGAPPRQCEALLKPLNALGAPLSRISLDGSDVTAATTHYDIVPPPPDAYGPGGSRPSGKAAKSRRQPASRADADPSFGGLLPPPGG